MKMYALRDRERPGWDALTSYYRRREDAEEVMANSTRHDRAGEHPGHEYLEIVEVERDSHPCIICGGESTAKNPEKYPYCRNCHYVGNAAEHMRSEQMDELARALHVDGDCPQLAVWHTGGGCFMFAITYPDGYYMATDGEASLPEDENGPIRGSWGYLGFQTPEDYEKGEDDGEMLFGGWPEDREWLKDEGMTFLSDDELVQKILAHRRLRSMPNQQSHM